MRLCLIWNKLFYLTLFFIIVTLISCTASNNGNSVANNNASMATQKDVIKEISNKLESFIANKYYDYESKKIIKVFIKKVSSNYYEEPLFPGYIYDCIAKKFNGITPFELVSSTNPHLDSIIDIHIIKDEQESLQVLLNIIVPKDNTIIFTDIHSYKIDSFNLKNYSAYKQNNSKQNTKQKKTQQLKKNAHLTVNAINITSSHKAEDKYYVHTKYNILGDISSQHYTKEDTGSSGYYPSEQRCIINGKNYSMDSNKNFYKDTISCGTIELTASFKGAFWDGYDKVQIIKETHKKKFYIKIKKDDNILVNIFFIYNGNQKGISVEAKRVKQFIRNNTIEEQYEAIDVFSD